MHLNEITKSSDLVYQAKIFHVTKDTAELEDGKIVQRDVVHHSGGVCVVPLTERQTVLMVQQYRYPFHEVTLEIPAGKREPGEDPLECGLRELREGLQIRLRVRRYRRPRGVPADSAVLFFPRFRAL